MSNIRLNSILPDYDPVNNPTGLITLQGCLQLSSLTTLDETDTLSHEKGSLSTLGGLAVKKSISVGGDLKFFKDENVLSEIYPGTIYGFDNCGIHLSGGGNNKDVKVYDDDYERGSSLLLYGKEHVTGKGNAELSFLNEFRINSNKNKNVALFSSDETLTLLGNKASVSSVEGTLLLPNGGLSIACSFAATNPQNGGSATLAGGLAVGKNIECAGTGKFYDNIISTKTIESFSTEDADFQGSGSFRTLGGMSIAKSLRIGQNADILANVDVHGRFTVHSTSDIAATVLGGLFISKNLTVKGALTVDAPISTSGKLTVENDEDSTLSTNGSAVFYGGVGICKHLNVDKGATFAGNVVIETLNASILQITNTVDSFDNSSGALIVDGGILARKSGRFLKGVFAMADSKFERVRLARLEVVEKLLIKNSEQSLSPTSGAFVCDGGMGVKLDLNVQGNIRTWGNITSEGNLTVSGKIKGKKGFEITGNSSLNGDIKAINSVFNSCSISNTLNVLGESTIEKSLVVGNNLNVQGNFNVHESSFFNENVTLEKDVKVKGKITIGEGLLVNKNIDVKKDFNVDGLFTSKNATMSSSIHTGSVILCGGVGVGGSIHVGKELVVNGAVRSNSTLDILGKVSLSSSLFVKDDCILEQNVLIDESLTVSGMSKFSSAIFSENIVIDSNVESSSHDNGALIVNGGVGMAGNLNIQKDLSVLGVISSGGIINSSNVTDSDLPNNGSAVFAGGVGILRNLNVGGGFSVGAPAFFSSKLIIESSELTLGSTDVKDVSGLLTVQSTLPGLLLSRKPYFTVERYENSISMFSLGSSYSDVNHEVLQLTTTSTNTFTILTRKSGTGIVRRLMLQAGAKNVNQLTLNKDGTVSMSAANTVDSSSTSTGALKVSGGLGVTSNISIGKKLQLFGTEKGMMSFQAHEKGQSYNLKMPSNLPNKTENVALVCDNLGNLSWSSMVTANPLFENLIVSNTTENSIRTNGGIKSNGSLSVGGLEITLGTQNQNNRGYSGLSRALVKGEYSTLIINKNSDFTNGVSVESNLKVSGYLNVDNAFKVEKDATVNGSITLKEYAIFENSKYAPPTLSNRSDGTRIILSDTLSDVNMDNAIGLSFDCIWYASSKSTNKHKWYSGKNNTMTLDGDGTLSTNGLLLNGTMSGNVTMKASTATTSYSMILPSTLPPNDGDFALVMTDKNTGKLAWKETIREDAKFQSLEVENYIRIGKSTIKSSNVPNAPTFTLPSEIPRNSGQLMACDNAGNLFFTDGGTGKSYSVELMNNVIEPLPIPGMIVSGSGRIDILCRYTHAIEDVDNNDNHTSDNENVNLIEFRYWKTENGFLCFQDNISKELEDYIVFSIDENGQVLYKTENEEHIVNITVTWTGDKQYSTPEGGVPISVKGDNNVTEPRDVPGFTILGSQFSRIIQVSIASSNRDFTQSSLYELTGVRQPTGNWEMRKIVTGPEVGINFFVTKAGQLQYTSENVLKWISTNFSFYPTAIPLQEMAKYDVIIAAGTNDATSESPGTMEVHGGMTVDKTFYKGFSNTPTATWMTKDLALQHGSQTLTSAALKIAPWMPNVNGIQFSGSSILLSESGTYAINLCVSLKNDFLLTSTLFVNTTEKGNGLSQIISNNEDSEKYILAQMTNQKNVNLTGTFALNKNTVLNIGIFPEAKTTAEFITFSVTLLQHLK